jgi:hypothetical protein
MSGGCCCIPSRARATERAAEKRRAAEQGGPDAKVPRSATPAGAESSAANTPARTPTPTPLQQQQQQQQGGDVLSMLLPGGIARSADPTSDVQRVLEVLVEHQQHTAVEVSRDRASCFACSQGCAYKGCSGSRRMADHQQHQAVEVRRGWTT